MTPEAMWTVVVAALAVGAFAGWHSLRGYRFSNPLLYAVGALEIGLIGILVGGLIALGRTNREISGVLFISYLVTLVVVPPASVLWGVTEKSRWGTGVVAIAMITVAALVLRLEQIWRVGG